MSAIDPQGAAYLYLRKSRSEEQDERAGIDVLSSHRSRLLELARKDGIEIPQSHIYAEIGSGDDIASRPEFVRLLGVWQRLPRNHGGSVYCTEISRLSRGLQSQQGLVQDTLARAGVLIRTPNRYYDLRQSEDAFLFEAEGLIARSELRNYKARTEAARAEMTRQGKSLTGRAPYGYVRDKNQQTFLPHPDEFLILRAFLRDLFRHGIDTVAEKYGLTRSKVRLAARNPVVCGWPAKRHGRHHGEKPWRHPYAPLPREEWVWPEKPGTWEVAISRAEWEELQEILDRRFIQREKHNTDEGWCRDVLQFRGAPGRVSLGSKHSTGRKVPTYDRIMPDGRHLYIAREKVHAAALDLLEAALGPESQMPARIAQYANRERTTAQEPALEIAEAERQLARLRAQLDNLTLRLADPDTDAEQQASLARVEKGLTAQIKAQREALQQAQTVANALPQLDDLIDELPAFQADFRAAWEGLDAYARRRLVSRAIALIEVTTEPRPDHNTWRREVTACVPAGWLAATMGEVWGKGPQSEKWLPIRDISTEAEMKTK